MPPALPIDPALPAVARLLIRRATPADAALVAALAARTFAEKWAYHNTAADIAAYLAANFGEAYQRAELLDPGTTYLLAEIAGEAVGYARLLRGSVPACVPDPAAVELARLYLLAPWQGHKVGATLMHHALAEAHAQGARMMWLGVWPGNAQALLFYQAWGFREVGRKTFILGEDVSEDLLMVRDVAPTLG